MPIPTSTQETTVKSITDQIKEKALQNKGLTALLCAGALYAGEATGLVDSWPLGNVRPASAKTVAAQEPQGGISQQQQTVGEVVQTTTTFNQPHPTQLSFTIQSVKKSKSGKVVFLNAHPNYKKGWRLTCFTSEHPNLGALTEEQLKAMYLGKTVTSTGKPNLYNGLYSQISKQLTIQ